MATFKEWIRGWKRKPKWQKVSLILAVIFFISSVILALVLHNSSKKDSNKIMAGLEELYKRIDGNIPTEEIEAKAKKTFEVSKNLGANFIYRKGYEKKGGVGTWFTPEWEGKLNKKFYLLDFVGNLDRNRLSVFFTEENKLIAQILTSDGRKESIEVNIDDWKKGEPYLIILQWDTDKNWVQFNVNGVAHEKTIPNLSFEVLGPVAFMGVDFEGKFPGRFRTEGVGMPKISDGLKSIGMVEYVQPE